jgi:hypothetical protein
VVSATTSATSAMSARAPGTAPGPGATATGTPSRCPPQSAWHQGDGAGQDGKEPESLAS